MKKAVFFFLILSFFVFSPKRAYAQNKSNEFYNELLSDYREYQGLLEPFSSAKSRYLAYQSVSAQSEFLEVSKRLIKAEIEAMRSYASFVKTYLAEATKILNYDENYIYVKLDDELQYLDLARVKADSVTTLSEAEALLKELESHHQRISLLGYQTKALTEIGSVKKIFDNLKIDRGKIDSFLSSSDAAQNKVPASREKLSSLDLESDKVSTLIREAETSYKSFAFRNAAPKSKEIWDTVTKSVVAMKSLLKGYRDIIFNFK